MLQAAKLRRMWLSARRIILLPAFDFGGGTVPYSFRLAQFCINEKLDWADDRIFFAERAVDVIKTVGASFPVVIEEFKYFGTATRIN